MSCTYMYMSAGRLLTYTAISALANHNGPKQSQLMDALLATNHPILYFGTPSKVLKFELDAIG